MAKKTQNQNATIIINRMAKCFNISELKDLCLELEIDFEANVPLNANKNDIIRSLVTYMARREEQRILINLLKKLRPESEWPNFYTIPFQDAQKIKSDSRNSGQLPRSKNQNQKQNKARRISTEEKVANIERELFENVFMHTKMYVWIVLLSIICLLVLFLLMTFNDFDHWLNDPVIFALVVIAFFFVEFYSLFWITDLLINRRTGFYSEITSVPKRANIKSELQKREWGNAFWNITCKFLIEILLITNKNVVNKIKRQPKKL